MYRNYKVCQVVIYIQNEFEIYERKILIFYRQMKIKKERKKQ